MHGCVGGRDDGRRRRWRRQPVHQHGELIFQGQVVPPAVRRAGDGEINDALAFGRHCAAGIADGLGIEPVARAQGETVRLINQRRIGFIRDGDAKNQRVLGVETKGLLQSGFDNR